MCQAFQRALLSIRCGKTEHVYLKGHRWSGGFPQVKQPLEKIVEGKAVLARSYFDPENNFGACGDYFEFPGSIEGN